MPTLYNPTSPDKRGEPADLRDNRISHIADGKVTLDSLVVDVHIQWVCGKSSVRGSCDTGQVRAECSREQWQGKSENNQKHSSYERTLKEHTSS